MHDHANRHSQGLSGSFDGISKPQSSERSFCDRILSLKEHDHCLFFGIRMGCSIASRPRKRRWFYGKRVHGRLESRRWVHEER